MIRLTKLRHTTIIAHEEGLTSLTIVSVLLTFRQVTLIHTPVVVRQDARDIQSVRTRHTIVALVTRHRRILLHQVSRNKEKLLLLIRQLLERSETTNIVLQVLHIGHTTQCTEHIRIRATETECPRSHTVLRLSLLQSSHQVVRNIRQSATQQRLHNHHRDIALRQFIIHILSRHRSPHSMVPIQVVHLNLHEVPRIVTSIMLLHTPVKRLLITVEREAQMTNPASLLFLPQEVIHTILEETLLRKFQTTLPHHVHQVVVNIVS